MPPPPSAKVALFRRLFEAEAPYVWLTLRRLGVREADLEDLSHELFMKVHARLDDYDDSRSPKPWLFAFAFRIASDERRSAARRASPLGDDDVASDDLSADERLDLADRRALLARALARVPIERRAVLVAHEMDEIPMRDVAESLDIPLATAYSRLRVARDELRAALERFTKQGGGR